ncbi:hypothetical protein [uncultured Cohaesibacter sp.]|uniref:hypothetical protein n=1 Tax=uncultured Cohaesibacter sp. TaxID=1002546 RepID=UPI0029C60CED|nr:hypothetical protein [uncultured Cohaesibacter sp.]
MIRIIVAALLLLSGPALADECKSSDGNYVLKTGPDTYTFKALDHGKTIWTIDADYACSQGIVFCGITFDTTKGPFDLPVEFIEASNGEKYVVFSQASQSFASSYMRVDGFDVVADRAKGHEQDEINIPNIFRCR